MATLSLSASFHLFSISRTEIRQLKYPRRGSRELELKKVHGHDNNITRFPCAPTPLEYRIVQTRGFTALGTQIEVDNWQLVTIEDSTY